MTTNANTKENSFKEKKYEFTLNPDKKYDPTNDQTDPERINLIRKRSNVIVFRILSRSGIRIF